MPGPFLNYSPHPSFVILLFALLLGAVMLVLRFAFVGFAFQRLGISRGAALVLLWLSLLGSNVNIPVAQMPAQHIEQDTAVSAFGMIYVIPRTVEVGRTIIAVNLGGAIIPVLVSLYLMFRFGLEFRDCRSSVSVSSGEIRPSLATQCLAQGLPSFGSLPGIAGRAGGRHVRKNGGRALRACLRANLDAPYSCVA